MVSEAFRNMGNVYVYVLRGATKLALKYYSRDRGRHKLDDIEAFASYS
jgi:hypothetical protein